MIGHGFLESLPEDASGTLAGMFVSLVQANRQAGAQSMIIVPMLNLVAKLGPNQSVQAGQFRRRLCPRAALQLFKTDAIAPVAAPCYRVAGGRHAADAEPRLATSWREGCARPSFER